MRADKHHPVDKSSVLECEFSNETPGTALRMKCLLLSMDLFRDMDGEPSDIVSTARLFADFVTGRDSVAPGPVPDLPIQKTVPQASAGPLEEGSAPSGAPKPDKPNRERALEFLGAHGPATARQVHEACAIAERTVHVVLSELIRAGRIHRLQERRFDPVSGRTLTLYALNDDFLMPHARVSGAENPDGPVEEAEEEAEAGEEDGSKNAVEISEEPESEPATSAPVRSRPVVSVRRGEPFPVQGRSLKDVGLSHGPLPAARAAALPEGLQREMLKLLIKRAAGLKMRTDIGTLRKIMMLTDGKVREVLKSLKAAGYIAEEDGWIVPRRNLLGENMVLPADDHGGMG